METGTKIVKLSAVTAAVYLGMKFVFPVALPFLIALVLARMLYPLAKAELYIRTELENLDGGSPMLPFASPQHGTMSPLPGA